MPDCRFCFWRILSQTSVFLTQGLTRNYRKKVTLLACAVAGASIELLLSSDWRSTVARIEQQLASGLESCRDFEQVADVRVLGAIGVVELKEPVDMRVMLHEFVGRGVWVRPFKNLVYVMPPFVISPDDLSCITEAIVEVVAGLAGYNPGQNVSINPKENSILTP